MLLRHGLKLFSGTSFDDDSYRNFEYVMPYYPVRFVVQSTFWEHSLTLKGNLITNDSIDDWKALHALFHSFLIPTTKCINRQGQIKKSFQVDKAKSPTAGTAAVNSGVQTRSAAQTPVHDDQTWTIETKLGYWHARAKTPLSKGVIISVVSLAVFSLAATSLSFPNPDTLKPAPASSEGDSENPDSRKPPEISVLTVLFSPITFMYRPLLVTEHARAEAQKTWLFWVGASAGFSALFLFGTALFLTPRYTRSLTISSASVNPTKGGVLRFKPAWGRSVTSPLADTILVSPLLDEGNTRDVMRTVSVEGTKLRGALWGWGLPMLSSGAVVNGKQMSQSEVIKLLERIWVQRGGEIGVDGVKRSTVRGLFSKETPKA
ncbi:hypothetical protein CPB84DRAFT_1848488 [Gymnopilus junonius]|uniref:Uncharacterized protein n=1 Tax=Gymnopilus junonius TaxID=109634 RepID=A0A9P5NI60_GYMJU|nr:hypothetical protein CPB84DRAFT_1848488 [Gymnopilus junonius]